MASFPFAMLEHILGSGHFTLAAARRLGRELTRLRSGEVEPNPTAYRHAVRDVTHITGNSDIGWAVDNAVISMHAQAISAMVRCRASLARTGVCGARAGTAGVCF